MGMREPLTIRRLRKSAAQSPVVTVLLWHIDALVERLKRFENLDLTDAQIQAMAGRRPGRSAAKTCGSWAGTTSPDWHVASSRRQ